MEAYKRTGAIPRLRMLIRHARCSGFSIRSPVNIAFVSAGAVPQLADGAAVMAGIRRREGVRYPVLVPNERGLDAAIAACATEVAVFTAASEEFARRNINASIAESIDRFRPVAERAKANGLRLRGYVSTAFGCPQNT